jgi:predicted dithiol-disulfide oxidoreductase (DUF899 family)
MTNDDWVVSRYLVLAEGLGTSRAAEATLQIPIESAMTDHRILDHDDWLAARERFLAKEKEFTRLRERLSRERRELPWERVEEAYVFESEDGRQTLADLFSGRSQLIVYHFMYEPDWDIGCPSRSFWADHYNGMIAHLNERDVSLVATSQAPLKTLQAQAKCFGSTIKWVSCVGNAFNLDFNVWFAPETLARSEAVYNYGSEKVTGPSSPGISAFFKDDGHIFHTYSTFTRPRHARHGVSLPRYGAERTR